MVVKTLLSFYVLSSRKASLMHWSAMVIQLRSVTTSCALAAPDELSTALQSATQFLFVHSICYLIISTGLSLPLANFSLYQTPFLHHS